MRLRAGSRIRSAANRPVSGGQIIVSAISAWEIAMLVERERLVLSMDVGSWLATVAEIEAVRFVPYIPHVEDTIWREFRRQFGWRNARPGRRVA